MWAVLALSATVLTSILPILNKQVLHDARPALVAWAVNAASLPLLVVGTLLLTPRPGAILAIVASMLWGTTNVLEKLAIEHMSPPSGPLVALVGTVITVLLLTPNALAPHFRPAGTAPPTDTSIQQASLGGLAAHPHAFLAATIISGVALLFGFTAITLGLVGYVTALFKLSAVFTILWAWLFLEEGNLRKRLLGAVVMILGGALVAT